MAPVLERAIGQVFDALNQARERRPVGLVTRSVGTVVQVGDGVARITGLPHVKSGELLRIAGGITALALDLEPDFINAVLLDRAESLRAGALVEATGKVLQVPVGPSLIGRVVDALGRPLDNGPPIAPAAYYPVERPATPIIERAPVSRPLQTGVKAVDALVPIGRGQRELILGDRQTGKTAIALDAVLNQRGTGVLCFYVVIGQRATAVAQLLATLRAHGAMEYTTVVAASGDEPAGMRYIAPYAATSMAEYFMERGRDVLIVYDDLTKHAESYRELSLVLRRPPAREAYPGDIFYAHARLLERATQLSAERGGGSLTALPIAETQAEDISAYVPTNLISITDGQIYVSTELFHQGVRPAVDPGKSVSRVGGKSQIAAYRQVAAQLRLQYSQFEELEFFSRLGTRLDAVSEQIIRRGRRIREVLKQPPEHPVPVGEQVALLTVLNEGLLDPIPLELVAEAETVMRAMWRAEVPKLLEKVEREPWSELEKEQILVVARRALAALPSAAGGEGA
ncbi:MAG: F0F1 ATP synthase subunit alpha [Limnochordales bacterium]|nr:F0F1 ATP synthase subunit alpha [Bacillota bacterium]